MKLRNTFFMKFLNYMIRNKYLGMNIKYDSVVFASLKFKTGPVLGNSKVK